MSLIHTEAYGQGPTLVMLHGWAMHSGVWREFAMRLARHCRVICVDLPGHGRSGGVEPFTLRQISETLLNALPPEPFTLLGWSLGATIAMDMVERCPDRVKSLIVLAGNPRFVREHDWPGVRTEILEGFAELLKSDVRQTLIRFLALQVNGLSNAKPLLQRLKQAVLEAPPPSQSVLQAGLAILKSSDLRESMLRNRVPISMILGDKDTLIPLASARILQRLNPGIELEVLESAGHAAFLSHPEELASKIIKVLR